MGFARMLTGQLTWSHAVDLAGHVLSQKHLALDIRHQIPENVLLDDFLVLILEFALMVELAFVGPNVCLQVRGFRLQMMVDNRIQVILFRRIPALILVVLFGLEHPMENLLRLNRFQIVIFFIFLVTEKYFHMVLLLDAIHFIDYFRMHEVVYHLRFDVTRVIQRLGAFHVILVHYDFLVLLLIFDLTRIGVPRKVNLSFFLYSYVFLELRTFQ